MPRFRTKTLTMHYGEGPLLDCQVCWKKHHKFGTLLDPNGRTWLICDECIRTLWDAEQAVNMQRRVNAAAEQRAMELIQEKLFGGDND